MIGIYKITNKVNNKVYVGQALDVDFRFGVHRQKLNSNQHINSHLQAAWNKYGQDNFIFEVIEECPGNKLNERELYWIDYYDAMNNNGGYNLNGVTGGHHSEETRQKISNALFGENNYLRGKIGDKAYWYGKKLSEEHKRKISESRKGKSMGHVVSSETRKKISKGLSGSKNHRAKLTDKQVLEIRNSNLSTRELMNRYNITSQPIYNIKNGLSYQNVGDKL